MNDGTLIYNTTSGAKHSFQIYGTEYAHIDSSGITMTTNISFPNNGAGLMG